MLNDCYCTIYQFLVIWWQVPCVAVRGHPVLAIAMVRQVALNDVTMLMQEPSDTLDFRFGLGERAPVDSTARISAGSRHHYSDRRKRVAGEPTHYYSTQAL